MIKLTMIVVWLSIFLEIGTATSADLPVIPTQEDFALAPPKDATTRPISIWATHYFVFPARGLTHGVALRDKSGAPISAAISPGDWCLGAIEGTIQIESGGVLTTFNYAGRSDVLQVDCAGILKRVSATKNPWISLIGKSYFVTAKGQFGDGVKGYRLVPFRTIAVDPKAIHYGTLLFIASAKGVDIPATTIKHDGYFFAADTGGALKGVHVDVFCGTSSSNCFPQFIKSDKSKPVEALIVDDSEISAKLAALHKQ